MKQIELIFKALSDPIRLGILKKLNTEESLCVGKIVDIFDISQSKISYHLKLLYTAELVNKTSSGKWNYYSLNREKLHEVLTDEVINKILS